jgi:hypothetical protein
LSARYGAESADDVLLIVQDFGIELVPFDREQMLEARSAWQRFGNDLPTRFADFHDPPNGRSVSGGDAQAYRRKVP